jgi:uncharacterized protein
VTERPDLADQKYMSLTTFRRDGTPVPTTVWVVRDGASLAFMTQGELGKVKRIRANPKVTVAPCTFRGKPLGDPVTGRAELVTGEDMKRIRGRVQKKYGLLGRLILRGEDRVDDRIAVRIALD